MVGEIGGMGVRAGGVGNVDPQQDVGGLGNQPVRQGGGGVMRALSAFAGKVKAFFQSIGTKVTEWKQARSEERQQAALQRATNRVDSALKKVAQDIQAGAVNGRTLDKLSAAMTNARKIDGQAPQEVLKERFAEVLRGQDSVALRDLAKMDFDGLKTALKQIVDHRVDRAVQLAEGLSRNGMGGNDSGEIRQGGARMKQEVDRMVDALRGGVAEVRRQRFEEGVGGLFPVGQDGRINAVRANLSITSPNGPMAPEDYLIMAATGNMGDALTNPTMILDVPVHKYAVADWFRMDIDFQRPDGQVVNSRPGSSDEEEAKLEDSALALYEIAGGDDTATTVLSALINQHGWRDVVHLFAGQGGQLVDFKPLPGGYDRATVQGPNGPVVTEEPGQIGDAKFTVSRNGDGDFVITVDWTMLSNGPDGDELEIMSPDNPLFRPQQGEEGRPINALGIRMQGTLVVSGEAAREGRLELTGDSGLQYHFTGKFEALG